MRFLVRHFPLISLVALTSFQPPSLSVFLLPSPVSGKENDVFLQFCILVVSPGLSPVIVRPLGTEVLILGKIFFIRIYDS